MFNPEQKDEKRDNAKQLMAMLPDEKTSSIEELLQLVQPSGGREQVDERLYSIQIEQSVLGAILDDNNVLTLCKILKAKHFYDPLNVIIFEAIEKLIKKNRTATPLSIKALIKESKHFNHDLNVDEYLNILTKAATGANVAKDYVQTIYEYHALRQVVKYNEAIAKRAKDLRNQTVTDLLTDAQKELDILCQDYRDGDNTLLEAGYVEDDSQLLQAYAKFYEEPIYASVNTEVKELDETLDGGFTKGELIIIAARPGMGKSALALDIAFKNGYSGRNGLFFSLEMTSEQVKSRHLSWLSRKFDSHKIPYSAIFKRKINKENYQGLINLNTKYPLQNVNFITKGKWHINKIKNLVLDHHKKLKQQDKKLDFIVVDHLHHMDFTEQDSRYDNTRKEYTKAVEGLKDLAKAIDCVVICLAQLNRATEANPDRIPGIHNLAEASTVEQMADTIIFPVWKHYHERSLDEKNQQFTPDYLEIHIAKYRMGSAGMIKASYEAAYCYYKDLEGDGLNPFYIPKKKRDTE
jgi:replicative DNA helicase